MAIESYQLEFKKQTTPGILVSDGDEEFWLPKSEIEIDGISTWSDFETLKFGEEIDVYIPDWLAEDKGLI